jgi:hypothetical protein
VVGAGEPLRLLLLDPLLCRNQPPSCPLLPHPQPPSPSGPPPSSPVAGGARPSPPLHDPVIHSNNYSNQSINCPFLSLDFLFIRNLDVIVLEMCFARGSTASVVPRRLPDQWSGGHPHVRVAFFVYGLSTMPLHPQSSITGEQIQTSRASHGRQVQGAPPLRCLPH